MNEQYVELRDVIEKYGCRIKTVYHFYMKNNYSIRQFRNAISSFAKDVEIDNAIALYDLTLRDTGEKGWLFTTAGIYMKDGMTGSYYLKYSEIDSVHISKVRKKDFDSEITICLKTGEKKEITFCQVNKTPLVQMLNEIIKLCNEGKVANKDQYLIIEDMNDVVKEAYILYIASFAKCDGEITSIELNRLYSLMVKIKINSELRMQILQVLSDHQDRNEILQLIMREVPKNSKNVIGFSLIKDLIIMSGTTLEKLENEQKEYLEFTRKQLNVLWCEIEFIQDTILLEQKYIKGEIDESKFTKNMSEISSRAAAVGFPIVALYLSGSVTGLSAAGVTSGLAALGLGGILGLSSMVTGIGMVALIGTITYSGVKKITSRSTENNKREYLIAEVMRSHQEVISTLIDDLNYLTNELNKLLLESALNREHIGRLSKKIRLYAEAFNNLQKEQKELNKEL